MGNQHHNEEERGWKSESVCNSKLSRNNWFQKQYHQMFAKTKILYRKGDWTKNYQSLFKPRKPLDLPVLAKLTQEEDLSKK